MSNAEPNPVTQAAQVLVDRRKTGSKGKPLDDAYRPSTSEEALSIQSAAAALWCDQMDDSIGAWKCGLPMGDKLILGPIFTRTIDTVPPVSVWPTGGLALVEPEFAFFLGCDLPARDEPYTPAEIDAAVVRTHLALELIHSRYENMKDCSFPEHIADFLVNQGLFIGPEVDGARAAQTCELTVNVSYTQSTTSHAGKYPFGHPRDPLYWFVEYQRRRGQGLVTGQAIITGSFAGVLEIPLNTDIRIEYEGLGAIDVHFKAKI